MTDNTQAVDKTQAAAQPADTVNDARDDVNELDQLLAQFDQDTKPDPTTQPDTKTAPQPDLASDVNLLKVQVQEWTNEKHKRAIADTVTAIRGDIPKETFDDEMVEAWLDAQARKDPRLAQAWMQREQNPRQWAKVQTELGKSLSKKVGNQPDPVVTADRAAVAAAVRGASQTKVAADPPPNFGQMTDAQLREYTRQNFGF